MLGPFGDVVNFGGVQLYLSWYPVALAVKQPDLAPPRLQAQVDAARRDGVAAAMTRHLGEIVPALDATMLGAGRARLEGGYIFAWGETDIHDRQSGLHNRYDVGVHSDRGYHSINTGKLTMAPLNAARLGERIGDAHRTVLVGGHMTVDDSGTLLVTVCIPAYDAAGFIGHTSRSVADQTMPDFRVVVAVEPKGAAETIAAMREFLADKRFTYYVNATNYGYALNVRGVLTRVRTPYYAILPHDDMWHPEFLELL